MIDTVETDIDLKFEEFFKKVDITRIEAHDGQSFTQDHKERMKQSFIKHDGYPYPNEIWPERFSKKFGS